MTKPRPDWKPLTPPDPGPAVGQNVETGYGFHRAIAYAEDRLWVDLHVRHCLTWLASGRGPDPWDSAATATSWPDVGMHIIRTKLFGFGPGEYATDENPIWLNHVLTSIKNLKDKNERPDYVAYELLMMWHQGVPLAEQAERLGRKERTVKRYWDTIYWRLLKALKRWG